MITFPCPKEMPLYTIKRCGEDFFRVTKRLFESPSQRLVSRSDFHEYDTKLDNALCRARAAVREYALCNDWEYFFTFTLDSRWSRYCLSDVIGQLLQWLQNLSKRKYSRLRYLLVPEQHKDGAWHFHGLISGIPAAPLPLWAPAHLRDDGYLDWADYRLKFGWATLSAVQSSVAVSFYVTKYLTKSGSDLAVFKGIHTYYHSRGLSRALPVGYIYRGVRLLDECCRHGGSFYSCGYFYAHIENVVSICDEVSEFYFAYLDVSIQAPDSEPVPALVGASYEQMILAGWCNGNIPVS